MFCRQNKIIKLEYFLLIEMYAYFDKDHTFANGFHHRVFLEPNILILHQNFQKAKNIIYLFLVSFLFEKFFVV